MPESVFERFRNLKRFFETDLVSNRDTIHPNQGDRRFNLVRRVLYRPYQPGAKAFPLDQAEQGHYFAGAAIDLAGHKPEHFDNVRQTPRPFWEGPGVG
jgi:hypothetical protein